MTPDPKPPTRCKDSNRTARAGSNRCTRDATQELDGIPLCNRHFRIRARERRIESWLRDGNECPSHPGGRTRINYRARTVRCTSGDESPCQWEREVAPEIWEERTLTPMELLLREAVT